MSFGMTIKTIFVESVFHEEMVVPNVSVVRPVKEDLISSHAQSGQENRLNSSRVSGVTV